MKYAWIDKQRKAFPLPAMTEALAVSVSGYRAWKRGGLPNRKQLTDAQLLALIQTIHRELKGAYGSPRMVREVRQRGFPASKQRVERDGASTCTIFSQPGQASLGRTWRITRKCSGT